MLERCVFPSAYKYGKIKKKTLKVRATTTEQTSITHRLQWRWYDFVTSMFNEPRRKNEGLCKNTGNMFGELMQNFLFGLGEACIMSYAGGDIIIVGASDRENNKNILAEKWVEIHILHGVWILYLSCSSRISYICISMFYTLSYI